MEIVTEENGGQSSLENNSHLECDERRPYVIHIPISVDDQPLYIQPSISPQSSDRHYLSLLKPPNNLAYSYRPVHNSQYHRENQLIREIQDALSESEDEDQIEKVIPSSVCVLHSQILDITGEEYVHMDEYDTYDAALVKLHQTEDQTMTKFIVVKTAVTVQTVFEDCTEEEKEIKFHQQLQVAKSNVKFSDTWDLLDGRHTVIGYNGLPFIKSRTLMLQCENGPKRASQASNGKRTKFSKKLDCPAKAKIIEVIYFPDYKLKKCTVRSCKKASQQLRNDIKQGVRVRREIKCFMYLPDIEEHRNHPVGEKALHCQMLDKRVITRIHELVKLGLVHLADVNNHLRLFIRDLFEGRGEPLPHPSNTRYYPTSRTLRNHVYRAIRESGHKETDYSTSFIPTEVEVTVPMNLPEELGTDEDTTNLIEITRTIDVHTEQSAERQSDMKTKMLTVKSNRIIHSLMSDIKLISDPNVIHSINQNLLSLSKYVNKFVPPTAGRKRKLLD